MNVKGLYALTPDCVDTVDLLKRVKLALAGGVQVLQYRNKIADAEMQLIQAQALRKLTRDSNVIFIINDDPKLAAKVDADGVHLGAADGEVAAARALLGENKLIGVSCYNKLQLARNAVAAGADYVAFGAFFSSSVKPNAAVASLALLREARAALAVPIVAIGGINAANGSELVRAGADALAVISAVFEAPDIELATQHLSKLFR